MRCVPPAALTAALITASLGLPAPASAASAPFAPTSPWNARVDGRTDLDPQSDDMVARLREQVAEHGTSVNIWSWSAPVHRVGPDQERVPVILDQPNSPALAAAIADVPVPASARAAAGTDANLVVWQRSTDTLWEFWRFSREEDGLHADWAGRMSGVSQSPGYFRDLDDPFGVTLERRHWGVTATKLARLGGLMTINELKRRSIPHALAFSIPEARTGTFSWPAQSTDGSSPDPNAIPEGAHFRLDPQLDLEALDLPPVTLAMAKAVQRHGMILHNQAGAVAFYGEDPNRLSRDPYPAILGGDRPADIARAFPWEHLQLMPMQLSAR